MHWEFHNKSHQFPLVSLLFSLQDEQCNHPSQMLIVEDPTPFSGKLNFNCQLFATAILSIATSYKINKTLDVICTQKSGGSNTKLAMDTRGRGKK